MYIALFLFYLADIIPVVKTALFFAIGISIFCSIMYCVILQDMYKEFNPAPMLSVFKFWKSKSVIALLLFTFMLPSANTLYVLAGASFTNDVVNTISSSSVFKKSLILIEDKIDAAISETKAEQKAIEVTQPVQAPQPEASK